MRRRNTTKANGVDPAPDEHLTPQHLAAIDLLVAGKTLTETATALGVGRPAVSEWVNHRPDFQAHLNVRRQELWASITETLRSLVPEAVRVLQEELHGEGPGRLHGRRASAEMRQPLWAGGRADWPHDGGGCGASADPAGRAARPDRAHARRCAPGGRAPGKRSHVVDPDGRQPGAVGTAHVTRSCAPWPALRCGRS